MIKDKRIIVDYDHFYDFNKNDFNKEIEVNEQTYKTFIELDKVIPKEFSDLLIYRIEGDAEERQDYILFNNIILNEILDFTVIEFKENEFENKINANDKMIHLDNSCSFMNIVFYFDSSLNKYIDFEISKIYSKEKFKDIKRITSKRLLNKKDWLENIAKDADFVLDDLFKLKKFRNFFREDLIYLINYKFSIDGELTNQEYFNMVNELDVRGDYDIKFEPIYIESEKDYNEKLKNRLILENEDDEDYLFEEDDSVEFKFKDAGYYDYWNYTEMSYKSYMKLENIIEILRDGIIEGMDESKKQILDSIDILDDENQFNILKYYYKEVKEFSVKVDIDAYDEAVKYVNKDPNIFAYKMDLNHARSKFIKSRVDELKELGWDVSFSYVTMNCCEYSESEYEIFFKVVK